MKSEQFTDSLRTSLYTEASFKAIQFPAQAMRSESGAELSDVHINLDQCVGQTAPARFGALYCDVLIIDHVVMLDRPVLIVARRIEVATGAAIVVSNAGEHQGELYLFAQEIAHATEAAEPGLTLALVGHDLAEQTIQWTGNGHMAKGLHAHRHGVRELNACDIDPALVYVGSPLHYHLQALSTLAVLLSADFPGLAIAQLSWVVDIACHHSLTEALAGQALAMIVDLQSASAAGARMIAVPPLDHQIYAASASSLKELLLLRQDAWNRLQDQASNEQNKLDDLQWAWQDRQEQVDLATKLELQANQTRIEIVLASGQAGSQLSQARLQLGAAANNFALGIRRWEEKKILSSVFDLVVESGKLLLSVACVVGGMPAPKTGVGTQGGGAVPVVSDPTHGYFIDDDADGPWTGIDLDSDWEHISIGADRGDAGLPDGAPKKTGATADAIAQLSEKAADGIAAVAGVAKAALAIYKITQMAKLMQDVSQKICSGSETRIRTELSKTALSGIAMVTGGEHEWLALENSMDFLFDSMGNNVLSEIEGGCEYRLEFKQMLVSAKALCQARIAVARANAQYVELVLRRRSAETMAACLRRQIQSGSDALQIRKALIPGVFARLIDAKRSVYIALESYRRALAYFTLMPPAELPALPRITDDIDSLCRHIAAICGKELSLKALRTPPQTMTDIEIVIDDPHTLAMLREQRRIQLTLDPAHPAFAGFSRIRMGRLCVFLDGLAAPGDLRVRMRSSGIYHDRTADGGVAGFIAAPLQKNFQYAVNSGAVRYDGDIAPRYRDDFFMPTPFTGWEFQFSLQGGQSLNLERVSALRLVFSGEASSLSTAS
ncbi:hypothetical protein PO883_27060 [Massilia sp. DJPM01]|uniref:hypothetical protein n=1 Tax=Massilia sp. DJPM01 TaxID=3024404 RepID=UPI00259D6D97|nr:hypothetical protein [Massilia sp. DJPM01]MDM5180847.1 hypothetical protein [Massilia sp. DJPM01]